MLALTPGNPRLTETRLSRQAVEELRGVGFRLEKRLQLLGVTTALDLARTSLSFIRKNFDVVLERTVRELNDESCILIKNAPPPKQQIVVSRSFGERIIEYDTMRQSVCAYADALQKNFAKTGNSATTSPFLYAPPLSAPRSLAR